MQERPDVPVEGGRVTGEMLEQVRPVLGEIVADRARVPLKLFNPVIVMVDVPATPTLTVTVDTLAEIVKSTK